MVNESRALQKIGEWADLSGEDLHLYLDIASRVQREKLDQRDDFTNFSGERYFEFLNEQVLPDERIDYQLESANIPSDKLQKIQKGEVPIKSLYAERYKLDYGLDQIVDFIMMMKFVHDYIEKTGKEGVAPRNRLQYLLYLVNYNLSQEDTLPNRSNRTNLKNLEHTGYRYTFSKSQTGPFSQRLYQDKNRLFAQSLLHEEVMEESVSQEDEPYRVSLGETGKRLFARYGRKLDDMESVLLKEWDLQQQEVLNEYAEMSLEDLKETIQSMPRFEATPLTDELLQARQRDFDEPMDSIQELILSV
ncbi:hypothetical protein JMJ58_17265 [Haloterrigena salifodinae]|uniref:Uncharacterized protein n=1 Tax=Haloterrigena salifodinae TaxID=2675099 RepID=A0A8T8DYK1_9EURY|nr:hypothetical protein [Haloterrigena salifodinae]QRV14658.1 hypothetical protein JMJ58_17265 [Haloterrigena salifodinae]